MSLPALLLLGALAGAREDGDHWLVDAAMPALPLTTLVGEPVAAPWTKQETVVVLWAGWCGPCVAELPVIAAAMDGPEPRAVVLLSIDEQPKVAERALRRAVRRPPPWTSVWGGPEASGQLGVRTVPTAFLVGADGQIDRVVTGHQSAADWTALLTP